MMNGNANTLYRPEFPLTGEGGIPRMLRLC